MNRSAQRAPGRPFPKLGRWLLALAVVGVAVGVYALRPAASDDEPTSPATTTAAAEVAPDATAGGPSANANGAPLPRLIDLGADKCVPCKMMAPILDQLRTDYAGRLRVDFIDVWKMPEAGAPYGIKLIPTQIFLAPDGTELFRHEGFFSREDILAKWNELGYAL